MANSVASSRSFQGIESRANKAELLIEMAIKWMLPLGWI